VKHDFGQQVLGQIFTLEFRAHFSPEKHHANVYSIIF
jgi:hypothetical protein